MSHQAGAEFFDQKRPWSRRKDRILGWYLNPYLAKLARLGPPILVVDGFAGPGKFSDGSPGSPLIIAEALRNCKSDAVSMIAAEPNKVLCDQLRDLLSSFAFADVRQQSFGDIVGEVQERASECSVFLYLDPFALRGISWKALEAVLALVKARRTSVEVLLNLNVAAFVRCARQVLSQSDVSDDGEVESLPSAATASLLNEYAGGDWWQALLERDQDFSTQGHLVTRAFCDRLRAHFKEVCAHELLAEPHHQVPKYVLLFGSRHPDARLLMNDAMATSLQSLAQQALPPEGTLFETRSEALVPDAGRLRQLVLELVPPGRQVERKRLVYDVMHREFGRYHRKTIEAVIRSLREEHELLPPGRKTNDKTIISRVSEGSP